MGIYMASNIKIKWMYLFISLFSLFIGIIIYLLYRENSILHIKDWGFTLEPNIFTSFIIYNIPDGLWLLSGLFIIRSIWFLEKSICNIYSIIFLSIAIIMEILIGTFDVIDLLIIISFAILEKNIYSKIWGKECI
jgi:hypothetical protein